MENNSYTQSIINTNNNFFFELILYNSFFWKVIFWITAKWIPATTQLLATTIVLSTWVLFKNKFQCWISKIHPTPCNNITKIKKIPMRNSVRYREKSTHASMVTVRSWCREDWLSLSDWYPQTTKQAASWRPLTLHPGQALCPVWLGTSAVWTKLESGV